MQESGKMITITMTIIEHACDILCPVELLEDIGCIGLYLKPNDGTLRQASGL